jgi:predicted nucleic acid-binding protein
MNLDNIPSGSLCVLDTNILIYAEQRASLESERLMRRIEEQDVIGMLTQPVWQETMHRLMIIEAIMLGHIRGPNPARQLAEKPDVVKKLTIYRDKVRALMNLKRFAQEIALVTGLEPQAKSSRNAMDY